MFWGNAAFKSSYFFESSIYFIHEADFLFINKKELLKAASPQLKVSYTVKVCCGKDNSTNLNILYMFVGDVTMFASWTSDYSK